jgi:Domain of unknown function (DUF4129)
MMPPTWSLQRGLDPSPQEARDWLTQELGRPEYQNPWLDSVIRWISDQLSKLFGGLGRLTGLSPLITVLLALAVIALLAWVLPKVRRESVVVSPDGSVLEDLTITARFYRDLAAQAMQEGRYDDAVLNAFRALAKDMSDRTLLHDAPGRTAHEVSQALASPFPNHVKRLAQAANLFDSVRYGHRRASADQAGQVQRLDAELAKARPVRDAAPLYDLPI